MNRKLKLKVSYRANFAGHIFPIVITFLYLINVQFGLVVHYLKDWLCCLYVSKKAPVLYTKLLIYVTIIGIALGV